MSYKLIYFNKSGVSIEDDFESQIQTFESIDNLTLAIQQTLIVNTVPAHAGDYQSPIELGEIKLFAPETLSYELNKLFTKPRLFYLPANAQKKPIKSNVHQVHFTGPPENREISHFTPSTPADLQNIGIGGLADIGENIATNIFNKRVIEELNSFSQPCFMVVGDEELEDFKLHCAQATQQPYFWQDIIKAFFARIFDYLCCCFLPQQVSHAADESIEEPVGSPGSDPKNTANGLPSSVGTTASSIFSADEQNSDKKIELDEVLEDDSKKEKKP